MIKRQAHLNLQALSELYHKERTGAKTSKSTALRQSRAQPSPIPKANFFVRPTRSLEKSGITDMDGGFPIEAPPATP